jgi:hypothetical protein
MRGHPTRECDGANSRSGLAGRAAPDEFVVVGGIVLGDIRRWRQCIALRRPMPDGKQASRLKSADQTVIQSEHMDGIFVESTFPSRSRAVR